MVKKILAFLLVVVAVFAVVVWAQPTDYSVSRSAVINAPAEAVFAQINDFHNWQAWSPWAKIDPNAKITFSGAESGQGATFAWDGNSDVGAGQMQILQSHPFTHIQIQLDFIKPFAGGANDEFAFAADGAQTKITWTMSGQNSFLCKAFGLFMSMDKMIGDDFEKGLAQLKSVVEKQ